MRRHPPTPTPHIRLQTKDAIAVDAVGEEDAAVAGPSKNAMPARKPRQKNKNSMRFAPKRPKTIQKVVRADAVVDAAAEAVAAEPIARRPVLKRP